MANKQYPVLMISPPPIADAQQNIRTEKRCEDFGMVCQALEIPFLDIFTPLSQSLSWRHAVEVGDGAHPGAEGYVEIVHLVQAWSVWANWFKPL